MKKLCLLLLCLTAILCGCTAKDAGNDNIPDAAEAEASDAVLSEAPQNVFALSSSIAEIWLLSGGKLAGVTDDAVKERDFDLPEDIKIVGTVKDPNTEVIIAGEPDLVLLSQDISSHRETAEILKNTGIPHYMAKVETLDDYLAALRDFTSMTGDADAYDRNGKQVEEEVQRLLAQVPEKEEDITALFLRAHSGGVKVIAKDHTVCYILEDIGVKNIAQSNTSLLDDLSVEAILESNPDYIFVITMGSSESAIAALEQSLTSHPAWGSLSSVQNGNMIILPKELYHYKPNNRWGRAYEHLLEIVYPQTFPSGGL